MNKAYRFRIYPNASQQQLINIHLGHNRFIWNKMLNDKINHFEETKETLYNTPAQYKKEFNWLKEVDSLSLANTQLRLEQAFRSFFKHKSDYPKYHSKKHDYGYTTNLVNNNITLQEGYIKLPKLGFIKIKQHRNIPEGYKLKNVTVSKTCTGKYYVSINYQYENDMIEKEIVNTIGLDFDMMNFYVDSSGNKYEYPKQLLMNFNHLRILQRSLSRRKKHGKNYQKKQYEVAKFYELIKHRRDDFLHKLSMEITNQYDSVSVETLDLKSISAANKFYAKQIHQFGWFRFLSFLKYKLEEKGKKLIQIDKWYPSSKICSSCGHIHDNLHAGDKHYICKSCGISLDRDYNAAINIKQKGLQMLGLA